MMLKSKVKSQKELEQVKRQKFSGKPLATFYFLLVLLTFTSYLLPSNGFSQPNDEIEFDLDAQAATVPLPRIFKPNIDLSGRGFHQDVTWPQTVAAKEPLEAWGKDIGFGGLYRLQYNLWEISQLSKQKEEQEKLLASYEQIIKGISDAGGTVILNLFGTPANFGRVLDKKSPPRDLRAFKALVKNIIRDLSCNKRYNIWYEVWSTPDLSDFFLGREQDYLNLYRVVAESARELKAETKVHIPVGGPSVSWWFQNIDNNTILTPEKSLIYALIKFCYRYRLPLDFVSWHGFSTDPGVEKEGTVYKKSAVTLIRDWLSYFDFDKNIPLVVDEWNFDSDANVLAARGEKSFIGASYIPSRIKNMQEAGLDLQTCYCLEDFRINREGVVRNVGVFSFDPEANDYQGAPKASYNVFKMLAALGPEMFAQKSADEFVGSIATRTPEGLALIFYNYIDPQIVTNFITKNIAGLNKAERKITLEIINSGKLEKIMLHQLDISGLRVKTKIKNFLRKVLELNDKAKKYEYNGRSIKIKIKNLKPGKAAQRPNGNTQSPPQETKENYLYQRYTVDASCSLNCEFAPVETKEIEPTELYQEALALNPYSVHFILFKKQLKEQPKEEPQEEVKEQPKEEIKVEPKVEPEAEPKAEPKEEPKESPKEQPKEQPKEPPKEKPKEEPKTPEGVPAQAPAKPLAEGQETKAAPEPSE